MTETFPPTVGVASTHPQDMPPDHAAIPVWNAENWFYEDFAVGHKIRSLRRTISEGESHLFNTLVLDIHPYVQDQHFAATEGIFGKRLVAGAFVFSAGLGLVATNCVNAFSYGYDKLRFIKPDDDDWYPQVGIFPLVEIPTGDARRGLGAGEWQEFLPVWLQKDWGDWTTYGGGGYWINPGPGNRDYWFFGWLLQKQITKSLALGVELFHQTSNMVGRSDSSGFNAGGQYDITEHDHILFSAGRGGIANAVDGPAVGYPTTFYFAFQWTS